MRRKASLVLLVNVQAEHSSLREKGKDRQLIFVDLNELVIN